MRLLAVALLVCAPLLAQTGTGSIRLEIKDPSDAPMQASVRLRDPRSHLDRTVKTAADGVAVFSALPPARYQVDVSRDGFAPQRLTVDLGPDSSISRIVNLALLNPAFRVQVHSTPLSGAGVPLNEIPTRVQTATAHDIEQSGALDLSDFLNRRLNGVHVNEVQSNPFQPDVNYRGYTASPLLGTPQGLSIYMDGVRLNQPFGDVVSWDLIPKLAIAETTLMPGSDPLFGLNTLGGALSIQTKDGRSQPGTTIQASGGSFGRRAVEMEHGGSTAKGLTWYLAGNLFHEDGWRQDSPSDVRQAFGKFGWQHANTTVDLTLAYAGNTLNGNGLQEERFLNQNYASVYTKPDITHNRSPFLNLGVHHSASSSLLFSGNVYYRFIGTDTLNADLNEDSLDQQVYQPSAADRAALAAAGYAGFPTSGANASNTPFPYWRCIAQVLQQDEPAEKCNGLINRTYTKQHNYGFSGQATWLAAHHRLTAGAALDRSIADFHQTTQLGYLNPDRSVTGVNAFADGVTGGTVDGVPYDNRVNLHGTVHTGSVYATDTFSAGKMFALTVSARYNRTAIDNADRIQPGGAPGSLDGHYIFGRLNPAAGLTFSPRGSWNAYFSYSEGSRAPTSIELGCADPNEPCKLPNSLAGDPPLKQVITRTFEAGVRAGPESRINWTLGFFRAQNHDDLLFVASEQTGFGYFRNFGRTRRQGFEANLDGRYRRLVIGGGYTFLNATYQSAETVDGSNNSSNNDGVTAIVPGDRIPLIPRHMVKAYGGADVTSKLSLDLNLNAVSSSYARGNEDNLHQADGVYYVGAGTSPGYAVIGAAARYRVGKHLEFFVQANNLLNRRFYTAAQLGPTGFTDQGNFIARPFPVTSSGDYPVVHTTFYAPGAPRGVWGGVRVHF